MGGAGVDQRVPLSRWLTLVLASGCALVPWVSVPIVGLAISTVLGALVVATVWSLAVGRRSWVGPRQVSWLRRLMAGVVVVGGLGTAAMLGAEGVPAWTFALPVAVVVALGPLAVVRSSSPAPAVLALLVLAGLWLNVAAICSWSGNIDVARFVQGGLDALAHGRSPYAITIDDSYGSAGVDRFYGPGVVVDGRVDYGYPYLPAPLVLDLPVHLVADVVWAHLALMAGGALLAWRLATDDLGRAAVLVLALGPSTPYLLVNYFVEAPMVGILALAVWGLAQGRRPAVVVGVGLLFSAKQYALFFVPAVWQVARRGGWRVVGGAVGVGAVVLGSFVLMDPHAFVRSAIELQFLQPTRSDAVSFIPAVTALLGTPPGWLLGVLPFAGLLVSAVVAARTRPGATSFALCVGLGLLASVLVSKQAFVNYYVFIAAALVLAGVCWPADDPVQTREPSSQGSRGERGISSTR